MVGEGDWVLVDDKVKGFVINVEYSTWYKTYKVSVAIVSSGKYIRYEHVPINRVKAFKEEEKFYCPDAINLALDTNDKEWFSALMEGVKND